ncbi:MAG: hypothetical protein EXQ53_13465 [Acidobacteria bacterium]|nr:hypothetical protein [Acidobacteriota bacterium]
MNTRFVRVAVAALAVSVLASTASAHHSLTVEFDITRTVTLSGVITEMKWTNPHGWLYVDVKDEKGQVRNWAIEFASPNNLYRRGWRRDDLPPKIAVTVTGYPSLDKSPRISATDVKFPDGRTLFAGAPPTGPQ